MIPDDNFSNMSEFVSAKKKLSTQITLVWPFISQNED